MNARVCILFKPPTEEDWQALHSLASSLTNNQESIRVFAGDKPGWLVAEFTMRTEPQYKAVDRIDWELKLVAGNRLDSAIGFPHTEAERKRADRKAARRRARRQESKDQT